MLFLFVYLVGGPGFEPGLAESESAVLPLDDPPIMRKHLENLVYIRLTVKNYFI